MWLFVQVKNKTLCLGVTVYASQVCVCLKVATQERGLVVNNPFSVGGKDIPSVMHQGL